MPTAVLFPIRDHPLQLCGDCSQPGCCRCISHQAGFAQRLDLAGQLSAFFQAKCSQNPGQFMRFRASLMLPGFGQGSIRQAIGGSLENGDPFVHLWEVLLPKPVHRLSKSL